MTKTSLGLALLLGSCGGSALSTSPEPSPPLDAAAAGLDLASCAPGAELTGASYVLEKSRFSFGSTPSPQNEPGFVRWVGADGALAIWSNGSAGASLNGGAPEASLPDWSNDPPALQAHVQAYFASMGVPTCQISTAGVNGGSGGRTIDLARAIDGIPIGESHAYAHFVVGDQTTDEGFYWPTIPADVVSAARSFRDRLDIPAGLAAYKALLPNEAQGDGQVIIRHTESSSTAGFTAAAVYDVLEQYDGGGGGNRDFDANGKEVTIPF